MEAVREHDLFKYLVWRDEGSEDERQEVLKNISIFMAKIPRNIFKNEYYVLYEAITRAKKYNTVLTYNQLYQIIINNIDEIITRKQIIPEEFADNPSDKQEVREKLAHLCMTTYVELKALEVLGQGDLQLNIDLYLKSWAQEELQKVIATQHEILVMGKKVGNKFLYGIEEANRYYQENYAKIIQMVSNELLESGSVIRSDKMSYQEVKQTYSEESQKRGVTHTGVDGIDENIGDLRKGDLVAILGQPGAGKSRFTANLIYNALMRGQNVLWDVLEGSAAQALSLLLARHILEKFDDRLDLDDKSLYDRSYPEELSETVDFAFQDLLTNPKYGKFFIDNNSLYEDEVVYKLESIWDEGFYFDMVVIDYVSLIMSKKNESPQIYLSRLVKTLKNMCMNFKNEGFLLVLPHQLTREVIVSLLRGEDLTITGSADTSEVIKSADIVFSLSRTEEQELKDMMTIYFTKTRFSKPLPPLDILSLHGKCYFTDLPS